MSIGDAIWSPRVLNFQHLSSDDANSTREVIPLGELIIFCVAVQKPGLPLPGGDRGGGTRTALA